MTKREWEEKKSKTFIGVGRQCNQAYMGLRSSILKVFKPFLIPMLNSIEKYLSKLLRGDKWKKN